MRKAWPLGVVSLLLLSNVSRLFTRRSFEATPTQDGMKDLDLIQAYSALLATLLLESREIYEVKEAKTKTDMVKCHTRGEQIFCHWKWVCFWWH